jgi:hypothetical protein
MRMKTEELAFALNAKSAHLFEDNSDSFLKRFRRHMARRPRVASSGIGVRARAVQPGTGEAFYPRHDFHYNIGVNTPLHITQQYSNDTTRSNARKAAGAARPGQESQNPHPWNRRVRHPAPGSAEIQSSGFFNPRAFARSIRLF